LLIAFCGGNEQFLWPSRLLLSGDKELAWYENRGHCPDFQRHHPDAGGSVNDRIRQINAAYQILLAYCRDYRFSFSREEFLEQRPEERLGQQFAQDPIWGG